MNYIEQPSKRKLVETIEELTGKEFDLERRQILLEEITLAMACGMLHSEAMNLTGRYEIEKNAVRKRHINSQYRVIVAQLKTWANQVKEIQTAALEKIDESAAQL